eukprot:scaffold59283_cov62-Phaeocystis_antarctica.AAC.2
MNRRGFGLRHPPSPPRKVGHGGVGEGARFHVACARPRQLNQHGVQRSDGSGLRAARPKRHSQRANDFVDLGVGIRELYLVASHVQRLLGCQLVRAVHLRRRHGLAVLHAHGMQALCWAADRHPLCRAEDAL